MSARYFSRMVGLAIGGGGYNGKYRGRSAQHERIVCHGTEIRENVIGGHIEQTAANSSQNVYTPEMLCREETQEQCTEPVKPQHIEKNVHESCMHEHICQ